MVDDLNPILYEKNARTFETFGIGFLPSWIDDEIEIVEERNGEYYLEGTLPANGLNVDQLAIDRIIYAAPAPNKAPQPFRIQDIKKDSISNTVTVYAPHISYQLAQTGVVPVEDDSPTQFATAQAAMNDLWTRCKPTLNGTFVPYSDITPAASKAFGISEPASVRSALGGVEGSMIDVFGGELEWDGWTVKLLSSRGTVTSKLIRYGANMESLSSETDAQPIVTAMIGYVKYNGFTISGDMVYLNGHNSFAYPRVEMIDFTEEFSNAEFLATTQEITDLTTAAVAGKAAELKTSITITAVPEELQDVYLCDTVTVVHPGYNLQQTSKVVRVVFDPIKEVYKEITIGEIQQSITDTIAGMLEELNNSGSSSDGSSTTVPVDSACSGWKGFGVGWDIAKNARTINMDRSEFEPDGTGSLTWQKVSGKDYWYTPRIERPLDMPIEPYNGTVSGTSDRPFVTDIFGTDLTHTRCKFRLGSPVDPAAYDAQSPDYPMGRPYIRLHVGGRRPIPPRTAPFECEPASQGINLADIAKTYLTAREGGRHFKYGANWPYRTSNVVNDSGGYAMMECDTMALMALIGMDYSNSPYTNTTPGATADFDTVIAAWTATAAANSIPWFQMSPDQTVQLVSQIDGVWINGLNGRIVDQGAMAWWFWDNDYVFRPERKDSNGKWQLDLTQLRSGDIVLFRRTPSRMFDNVGHIGIIDVDNSGTVYVLHVTEGAWTNGEVVVRSRLKDQFFSIAPGRYHLSDLYFARIPYGSTGDPDGSRIEPDADPDED